MDQSLGAILFATAVIGNFALIVVGVACTIVISFYRGHVAARERRAAARRHDAAFHHPDPVRTPLFEWVFMLGATAVVLVGLPVILAATFHYVVPMLGRAWTP
jgi:uncharacterized membrane protein